MLRDNEGGVTTNLWLCSNWVHHAVSSFYKCTANTLPFKKVPKVFPKCLIQLFRYELYVAQAGVLWLSTGTIMAHSSLELLGSTIFPSRLSLLSLHKCHYCSLEFSPTYLLLSSTVLAVLQGLAERPPPHLSLS